MTAGQNRLEKLVDSSEMEPEDLYKFLVSDLEWFLLGITVGQCEDLQSKLSSFDKKRVGLWLKK